MKVQRFRWFSLLILVLALAGVAQAYNSDTLGLDHTGAVFVDMNNPTCVTSGTYSTWANPSTPACHFGIIDGGVIAGQAFDVTVYVKNGTYWTYENDNKWWYESGKTYTNALTITAYPGEQVNFTTAIEPLYNLSNEAWTDETNSTDCLYSYTQAYLKNGGGTPTSSENWPVGTYANGSGLFSYNNTADFYTKDGNGNPIYGEGVTWDGTDLLLQLNKGVGGSCPDANDYQFLITGYRAQPMHFVNNLLPRLTIGNINFPAGYAHIYLQQNTTNVLIENCTFGVTHYGVDIRAEDKAASGNVTIRNNAFDQHFIMDGVLYPIKAHKAMEGQSIYINGLEGPAYIINNTFNNTCGAIQFASDSTDMPGSVIANNTFTNGKCSQIEYESYCDSSVIAQNNISNVHIGLSFAGSDAGLGQCSLHDNIINANLMQQGDSPGDWDYGYAIKTGDDNFRNWTIYNNIISGSIGLKEVESPYYGPGYYDVNFTNNVFSASDNGVIQGSGWAANQTNFYDYNLYHCVNGSGFSLCFTKYNTSSSTYYWTLESAILAGQVVDYWDAHSLNEAPEYSSTYCPSEGSNLIDAGTSAVPRAYDYYGKIIYGAPDIGVCEFNPTANISINRPYVGTEISLYDNGLYMNITTEGSTHRANLTFSRSWSDSSSPVAKLGNVSLHTWLLNGTREKVIEVSPEVSWGSTIIYIGDMEAYSDYLIVNESGSNIFNATANGTGWVSFTTTVSSPQVWYVQEPPLDTYESVTDSHDLSGTLITNCNLLNDGIEVTAKNNINVTCASIASSGGGANIYISLGGTLYRTGTYNGSCYVFTNASFQKGESFYIYGTNYACQTYRYAGSNIERTNVRFNNGAYRDVNGWNDDYVDMYRVTNIVSQKYSNLTVRAFNNYGGAESVQTFYVNATNTIKSALHIINNNYGDGAPSTTGTYNLTPTFEFGGKNHTGSPTQVVIEDTASLNFTYYLVNLSFTNGYDTDAIYPSCLYDSVQTMNESLGYWNFTTNGSRTVELNCSLDGYRDLNTTLDLSDVDLDMELAMTKTVYQLNLFNEVNGSPFLVNNTEQVKLTIYCEDDVSSYEYVFSNASTSIDYLCDWKSWKVDVVYAGSQYFRTLIPSFGTYDVNIYLVDLDTDSVVQRIIEIVDLTGDYANGSIRVKGRVNGSLVVISQQLIDVSNKVTFYLLEDSLYTIEAISTDGQYSVIGNLIADVAGTQRMVIPSIFYYPQDIYVFDQIQWWPYFNESEGTLRFYYIDESNTTESVNVVIREYNASGEVLFNDTVEYPTVAVFTYADVMNNTAYMMQVTIVNPIINHEPINYFFSALDYVLRETGWTDAQWLKIKTVSSSILLGIVLFSFSGISGGIGLAVVAILASFLKVIGWFPIQTLALVALGLVAGLGWLVWEGVRR